MTYTIWNKQDAINGVEASVILAKEPFKNYEGDIILISNTGNRIDSIECKGILARVYSISPELDIDTFMQEYIAKLSAQEEAIQDIPAQP